MQSKGGKRVNKGGKMENLEGQIRKKVNLKPIKSNMWTVLNDYKC